MDLDTVETIAEAVVKRPRKGAECVIYLYFESGKGIECGLNQIRRLLRQTHTQHELFPFAAMIGRTCHPGKLNPTVTFLFDVPAKKKEAYA